MEKNQTMTDEQLARELQNGKRGGGRGKLLTVIGCAATAIGIFTSVTALTVSGLTSELCTVTLTDVTEYRNENNDMLESAERVVYNGQWMACELGKTYPADLMFWPRGKLDKLFRAKTIKTDYEDFNKHFNLSCDDADWALRFLSPSRMERILALTNTAFGDFSVSLHADGTLYIAVHSSRGFFDVGKGKEPPDALRRRFTRELKWCTDMIDVFRPAAE